MPLRFQPFSRDARTVVLISDFLRRSILFLLDFCDQFDEAGERWR